MRTFTVNNKEYKTKPFDFNLICDLEDMGVSMEEMERKSMSMVRGYFGLCAGIGRNASGAELQAHIINGGDFADLLKAMSEEMNSSDFFRSLNKRAEEEVAENQAEKTTETVPKKEEWEE